MSCHETGVRSIALQAFPETASAPGTPVLTQYRSTSMNLTGVGAGPQVTVQGGGGGTSNCTTDETSASFRADGGTIVQNLGFEVKRSGSCLFEGSYSHFKVKVIGDTANGQRFDSSANVLYGQLSIGGSSYDATCGPRDALVRMTCMVKNNQIYLNAEPVK